MAVPFAIFLMGPTGSGKTQLSLALSEYLACEIISVDSALVYKSMDIGTAKPSLEQRQQVPHHLMDIIEPSERYSAGLFVQAAVPLIKRICRDGRVPLLTGGTMFYFNALEKGLDDMPAVSQTIRRDIEELERKHGLVFLHRELKRRDPVAAQRIHVNDAQRIKRGLEVYWASQKRLSDFQIRQGRDTQAIRFLKFGLSTADRAVLHRRVEARLDKMLDDGLVDEVMALLLRGDLHRFLPSIRSVGYAQVWSYLIGDYDYAEMRKRAFYVTRQLIKRQLTWMRGMSSIRNYYLDLASFPDIVSAVGKNITEFVTIARETDT